MKRLVMISAVSLLAVNICCSTLLAGSKFEIGPKVGLGLNFFTGEDATNDYFFLSQDLRPKGGITFGAFGRIHLNDFVAFQLEVNYAQKGCKWLLEETVDDVSYEGSLGISLDYIEIPVLVRFTLPTRARVNPFLFAGGSIAFNTASELELNASSASDGGEASLSLPIVNARKTQYNFVYGVGMSVRLGNTTLELAACHSIGLSNVFDDVEDPDATENGSIAFVHRWGEAAEIKTHHVAVVVQFGFPL